MIPRLVSILLAGLLLLSGCADVAPNATPTPSSSETPQPTATPTDTTTPSATETTVVGTADRPWDVYVMNRRGQSLSVTVRIEQNETGAVVYDETLQLATDGRRTLTVEYPEKGEYTMTITVVSGNETTTESVWTYSFEIDVIPPDYEVIVDLMPDGTVSFFKESV